MVVFWNEARVTNNGEIYMQRVSPVGKIMLNESGKEIYGQTTTNGVLYVEASQDKGGNVLVACNNYENNNNTIFI